MTEEPVEANEAMPRDPARPAPTPLTFVLHSTERYDNDILVFNALDELSYRYVIARIVALDGSSVSHIARHFCKRRGIPFTLVLSDPALAPRDNRPRQHEILLAQKPAALLLFNQAGFWLEMAKAFHAAGVPTNFVHAADQNNRPTFLEWAPGHSPPQTPTMQWVTAPARKARRAQRVSEEHKREVKRICTARSDARRRALKAAKRLLETGEFGTTETVRRGRKPRAITWAGHRPTMMT